MDAEDRSAAIASIGAALGGVADPLALLESLFAVAPFGMQIYDTSGRSLAVNQAFLDLFGSAPPPGYSVLSDDIAERQGLLPLIRRAFAGETVRIPVTWYDPRDLRSVRVAEGNRVAIETMMFPIRDRQGDVTHVGVVFKDVTREETAREELEKERDLLSRTARFREQFIGVVGHDLRSPLAAIVASAGLILRHESLPAVVATAAARIGSAGDRMGRMIRDLLDFTQARLGGGLPLSRRDVDLASVLSQMVDEAAVGHPSREVSLTAKGDLRGSFDPDRIAQLVGNVLENALTPRTTRSAHHRRRRRRRPGPDRHRESRRPDSGSRAGKALPSLRARVANRGQQRPRARSLHRRSDRPRARRNGRGPLRRLGDPLHGGLAASAIDADRLSLAPRLAQREAVLRQPRRGWTDEVRGAADRLALAEPGADELAQFPHGREEPRRFAAEARLVALGLGLGPEVPAAQLAVLVEARPAEVDDGRDHLVDAEPPPVRPFLDLVPDDVAGREVVGIVFERNRG